MPVWPTLDYLLGDHPRHGIVAICEVEGAQGLVIGIDQALDVLRTQRSIL
jgi:hypothetical protein